MLIIEGSIDEGSFPRVYITTNIILEKEMNGKKLYTDSLYNHIMTWASVSLSDGTREVSLIGRKDNSLMPPYYYTTGRMRGEVGKVYTLSVEANGMRVEAVTSIPSSKPAFSLSEVQVDNNSSHCELVANLNEPVEFCRIEYQIKGEEHNWLYSNNGSYTRQEIIDRDGNLRVSRKYRDDETLFSKGQTIAVKVSAIDSITYLFWNDYDRLINLSRNPLFSSSENIRGNVHGDGFGIWAGYNSAYSQYEVE